MLSLYEHQLDALGRMKNGCILCGDVGSGKSLTALSYYYLTQGGRKDFLEGGAYEPMDDVSMEPLYIITTAKKRDDNEWGIEMAPFLLSDSDDIEKRTYREKVTIDSWNNIQKYSNVTGAFFIFDEQRVTGKGAWVKAFLKIARGNKWILLSATPGDTWLDYVPVFIANGFYRNRTEFNEAHVIFERFTTYPKVKGYFNEGRLIKLRNEILIEMKDPRTTVEHHETIVCSYDKDNYISVYKNRWDPFEQKPIENASQWVYLQRKVVNSSNDRQLKFLQLLEQHPRTIVFYSFDYELDLLQSIIPVGFACAQWNGHRHEPIPDGDVWTYLVQYASGSEGWNCTSTNAIIFWSQNYSYRATKQASGRINRLNTPYKDLYYYHLTSNSQIDRSIGMALRRKKNFNTKAFFDKHFGN